MPRSHDIMACTDPDCEFPLTNDFTCGLVNLANREAHTFADYLKQFELSAHDEDQFLKLFTMTLEAILTGTSTTPQKIDETCPEDTK